MRTALLPPLPPGEIEARRSSCRWCSVWMGTPSTAKIRSNGATTELARGRRVTWSERAVRRSREVRRSRDWSRARFEWSGPVTWIELPRATSCAPTMSSISTSYSTASPGTPCPRGAEVDLPVVTHYDDSLGTPPSSRGTAPSSRGPSSYAT
eukprot:6828992-Prymnesium_polylepis.1